MNFNFQEFSGERRKRLFIPLSVFSFSNFVVPIKFRQPAFAPVASYSAPRGAKFSRRHQWNGR